MAIVAAFLLFLFLSGCLSNGPTPSFPPKTPTPIPSTIEISSTSTTSTTSASITIKAATTSTSTSTSTSDPIMEIPEIIGLKPIIQGLDKPIYLTQPDDGSKWLFIIEQEGKIRIIEDGKIRNTPFLDITDRVNTRGNEQGLLGLAFHPSYRSNSYFFVHYTNSKGDGVISRFKTFKDPYIADIESEVEVLRVSQPYSNHNGGEITFGPEGYLYLGFGDGGSGGDPLNNGQDPSTLLGSILRLNVDELPLKIPDDNPFKEDDGSRKEIWVFGLRNPWRFSFDMLNGDLYIGDVGQNNWEEINYLRSDNPGGTNFGWNILEGNHCFSDSCDPQQFVSPIAEYSHSDGCSVTGGYVHRGVNELLWGKYIFGDYCSGSIWTVHQPEDGEWMMERILETDIRISSFGQDREGEVYVVDHNGGIYLIN